MSTNETKPDHVDETLEPGRLPLEVENRNGDSGRGRWYVICSNFGLQPVLARGAFLPSKIAGETGDAFLDTHGNWVLGREGTLPAEWSRVIEEGRRNAFPIALKISGPSASGRTGPVVRLPMLALGDVESLVFRNEKERDRFTSLPFAEYDLSGLEIDLEVDPEIFDGPALDESEPLEDHPPSLSTEERDSMRSIDGRLGMMAVILKEAPRRREWIDALVDLHEGTQSTAAIPSVWPPLIAAWAAGRPVSADADLDDHLLAAASKVIQNLSPTEGWPATELLDSIRQRVATTLEKTGRSADLDELATWYEWCRSVIDATKEPPPFGDDKSRVRRAILLLLLRGSVESLVASETSILAPGPDVRALALCLAAYREGLRSLGSSFKTPKDWFLHLSRRYSSVFDATSEAGPPLDDLKIEYRRIRAIHGEWIVKLGATEIERIPAWVDPSLERVFALGQDIGYDFQEHGPSGLKATFSWKDGRSQPVFVSILRMRNSPEVVVRFSSPALSLDFKSKQKTSYSDQIVKSKKVQKEFLVDLLLRNSRPELNCRFAISEEEQAVVVVADQLLGTLDEQEFQKHIEHVARVADQFEKDRGLDNYR